MEANFRNHNSFLRRWLAKGRAILMLVHAINLLTVSSPFQHQKLRHRLNFVLSDNLQCIFVASSSMHNCD